jgi:hypothetical protein
LASNLEPNFALLSFVDDEILGVLVDVLGQLLVAPVFPAILFLCSGLVLTLLVHLHSLPGFVLVGLRHFYFINNSLI